MAHHAIHHMLMVKIIATRHVGIGEDELLVGFGRAPSTIWYDLGVLLCFFGDCVVFVFVRGRESFRDFLVILWFFCVEGGERVFRFLIRRGQGSSTLRF